MSTRFHCVAAIIEKSTALAMKRHGGKRWALIRLFRLVPCGWKVIRYRQQAKALHRLINGPEGI
jgi:hypothetical protein